VDTIMPSDLSELTPYRERVAGGLNGAAIEIGAIRIEAQYPQPRAVTAWVEAEMPFGVEKARQLMAISRAFRELPAEQRDSLPAPWTTLFALTHLERPALEAGITEGIISPQTTKAQALALTGKAPAEEPKPRSWKSGPPKGAVAKGRMPPSVLIRELQRHAPDDLTAEQRESLYSWLASASV
jgi:hypothetical protein